MNIQRQEGKEKGEVTQGIQSPSKSCINIIIILKKDLDYEYYRDFQFLLQPVWPQIYMVSEKFLHFPKNHTPSFYFPQDPDSKIQGQAIPTPKRLLDSIVTITIPDHSGVERSKVNEDMVNVLPKYVQL